MKNFVYHIRSHKDTPRHYHNNYMLKCKAIPQRSYQGTLLINLEEQAPKPDQRNFSSKKAHI